MREIIAEQAAKVPSGAPAPNHYAALAWLAAVALIPLGIVMAVDYFRKRRKQ